MKFTTLITLVLWSTVARDASALILYGKDNTGNLTDPSTGVPFDAVAKVMNNSLGMQGSAVHLGGGYMLTANHVTTATNGFVSFDGALNLAIDSTFTPQQVASGVDLKIFKLQNPPPVSSISSLSLPTLGLNNTHVAWGVGRDPATPINTSPVTWGADSTSAKRWGFNAPAGYTNISYTAGASYSFNSVYTFSSSSGGAGADEAALTKWDSGSPMFEKIAGQWYLTGIAVTVSVNDSSSFNNPGQNSLSSNANFLVPVKNYENQILAIIPEISSWGLVLIAMSACCLLLRSRSQKPLPKP